MKAKFTNVKEKLVESAKKLTEKHWLLIYLLVILAFVLGSKIIAPLSASAFTYSQYPISLAFGNLGNVPFEGIYVNTYNGSLDDIGTILVTQPMTDANGNVGVAEFYTLDNQQYCRMDGIELPLTYNVDIPTGSYHICATALVVSGTHAFFTGVGLSTGTAGGMATEQELFIHFELNTGNAFTLDTASWHTGEYEHVTVILTPIEAGGGSSTECPTLEEQIADYDGSWYMFEQLLKANNYELWLKYSAELADIGAQEYSQGLSQGYQNGYMSALSGNNVEDPIDQYWNSTKDYILIAGQPYFTPNGFGAIDPYNTIGIYGEHDSKVHKQDGTTQVFNGQYVTEFASAGTLGGGWYKIGATVGDEYAYEQSFNVSAMDKAYYVSRVSSLGDPVEEFLVAIWLDDYEAWYVAEEYVHYGTVANNDKSYKQVYSIYMTDIRPSSQRFINYDNPTLYENFDEDVNATLYLATFNQLNNYNVYTDGIGIVESYNNGFDAGTNTTLWLDLLSQPIVAFFSIPLAQVIVEGVTYTLTYGIVLGAGIVALIVVWFLKLFAGG